MSKVCISIHLGLLNFSQQRFVISGIRTFSSFVAFLPMKCENMKAFHLFDANVSGILTF